jgi:hypothetical protein
LLDQRVAIQALGPLLCRERGHIRARILGQLFPLTVEQLSERPPQVPGAPSHDSGDPLDDPRDHQAEDEKYEEDPEGQIDDARV